MMDDILQRADATISELRKEREELIKRNSELHHECSKQHEDLLAKEQERARLSNLNDVASAERRLLDEHNVRV